MGERRGRGDVKERRHFGNVADGCVKCEIVASNWPGSPSKSEHLQG